MYLLRGGGTVSGKRWMCSLCLFYTCDLNLLFNPHDFLRSHERCVLFELLCIFNKLLSYESTYRLIFCVSVDLSLYMQPYLFYSCPHLALYHACLLMPTSLVMGLIPELVLSIFFFLIWALFFSCPSFPALLFLPTVQM